MRHLSPKWRQFIGKTAFTLLTALTDSVFLVSVFTPMAVVLAFRLARADPGMPGAQAQLLGHADLPGLVDYFVAFSTALFAYIIFTGRALFTIGMPLGDSYRKAVASFAAEQNGDTVSVVAKEGRDTFFQENWDKLVFFLVSMLVLFWGLYLFFLGGAASEGVVGEYLERQIVLGQWTWPVFNQLFIMRVVLASLSIWLIVLEANAASMKNEGRVVRKEVGNGQEECASKAAS